MCGIITLVNKNSSKVDTSVLEKSLSAISHRGPDDTGYHFQENVGLGFARLGMVDIAGGKQPFTNAAGDIILACNGEIYNYRELRQSLVNLGYAFKTQSDCEVILHLYEEDNLDFVKYPEGMFAFVIIDKRRNKIVLGRDRVGMKPLFYADTAGFFGCCSEIKGLIASGVFPRAFNAQNVKDGLIFNYIPGETTVFEGIFHVPPACTLEFDLKTNQLESAQQYWEPQFRDRRDQGSLWLPKYTKPLFKAMEQAVESHCMGLETPVSSYLSGDIDSTIVTGLLKRSAYGKDLCSFSIAFKEKEFDESETFKKTIAKFKINSEISDTENAFNGQMFYDAISSIEQPNSSLLDIPLRLLYKLVRSKNRRVVLGGEGSDELLGGYLSFVLNNLRWLFSTEIGEVFKDKFLTRSLQYFLGNSEFCRKVEAIYREDNKKVIDFFGVYPAWYPYWVNTQSNMRGLFRDGLQDSLSENSLMHKTISRLRDKLSHLAEFEQSIYVELKTRLPNYILARADRNSMANSVELRLPFLDNNVIDKVLDIPTVFKMPGVKEKFILKRTFKNVIPRHVRKKRKFGYNSPGSWIWNKPDELTMSLMSKDYLDKTGIFNSTEVVKMLENIKRGDFKSDVLNYQNTLSMLTGVLSVQVLYDKYIK